MKLIFFSCAMLCFGASWNWGLDWVMLGLLFAILMRLESLQPAGSDSAHPQKRNSIDSWIGST